MNRRVKVLLIRSSTYLPFYFSIKTVIKALFIVVLGLTPPLLSIWVMRQASARAQTRLRSAIASVATRGLPRTQLPSGYHASDYHYVEGLGYIVGDMTCRFNARSSYIRCAVNSIGPCQGCSAYESCI